MESNSFVSSLRVSGNQHADCTLLISDFFGLFPASFSRLIPMLETKYRIITYSDNGFDVFNRTTYPRHTNMGGYADDLLCFLREKKAGNITYIAHSVNALIAFHAAVKDPGLFDKIILLSATPYTLPQIAALYNYGYETDADRNFLFDKILQERNTEHPQQLHTLLGRFLSTYNTDKARQIFNIITTTDLRSQLSEINVPVMILQGTDDKIATSETAYFMHRHLPESSLIKIRAKGHLPQLHAPEEVCKAMEIFMHSAVC